MDRLSRVLAGGTLVMMLAAVVFGSRAAAAPGARSRPASPTRRRAVPPARSASATTPSEQRPRAMAGSTGTRHRGAARRRPDHDHSRMACTRDLRLRRRRTRPAGPQHRRHRTAGTHEPPGRRRALGKSLLIRSPTDRSRRKDLKPNPPGPGGGILIAPEPRLRTSGDSPMNPQPWPSSLKTSIAWPSSSRPGSSPRAPGLRPARRRSNRPSAITSTRPIPRRSTWGSSTGWTGPSPGVLVWAKNPGRPAGSRPSSSGGGSARNTGPSWNRRSDADDTPERRLADRSRGDETWTDWLTPPGGPGVARSPPRAPGRPPRGDAVPQVPGAALPRLQSGSGSGRRPAGPTSSASRPPRGACRSWATRIRLDGPIRPAASRSTPGRCRSATRSSRLR